MNQGSLQILKDPELVASRQRWEGRLNGTFDSRFYLSGKVRSGSADMYADPELRLQEAFDILAEYAEMLRDDKIFRPMILNTGLHGVHFVDKIFGAHVYELDGEPGNWQVEYLNAPVGSLTRPDLNTNTTWAAAKAFAEAFVASGVTVPVFSLPTIASALNVGLNLYGQELLLTMLTDPDAAHRDLALINEVLIELHDWYRANIPFDLLHQVACGCRYQPPGCGQVCGCSTQLVSAEQYNTFIADKDDAVLSRYPNGGLIHLCGAHTQHMDTWREMKSLTAIQLNDRAAEDLELYLEAMPEKTYYVNPCDGMPLERVEELAKDHRIVICSEPSEA